MDWSRRGVPAGVVAVLTLWLASPALAGEQLQLVTNEQLHVGAAQGTFTFSGDFVDAGSFAFESFLTAGPPSVRISTEHLTQLYAGGAGALEVQSECLSTFDGVESFIDTCQAVVEGGTGAYEDLHGSGTCSGVINLATRLATRVCHLRLNR
jgi:hypothetical protein